MHDQQIPSAAHTAATKCPQAKCPQETASFIPTPPTNSNVVASDVEGVTGAGEVDITYAAAAQSSMVLVSLLPCGRQNHYMWRDFFSLALCPTWRFVGGI
jgi:hypothetical protein